MPLRPARAGRVGVIGAPVAKTAVVAAAFHRGRSCRAEPTTARAGVQDGRHPSASAIAPVRASRSLQALAGFANNAGRAACFLRRESPPWREVRKGGIAHPWVRLSGPP